MKTIFQPTDAVSFFRNTTRLIFITTLSAFLPFLPNDLDAKNDKTPPGQDKKDPPPDPTPDPGTDSNSNSNSGNQIGDSTGSSTAKYHLSSWNVSGDYTIVGPTIMVIDGDLDIGNNTIDIATTGSLELYVGGNIKVNGKGGINNLGVPAQLLVFGTHPEVEDGSSPAYSWTLSGNGALTGVVYAPNAEYRTNGGGNGGFTSGSIVALDIRFNGSPGPFHFDEALADLVLPFGGYSLSSYELLKNGSYGTSTSASEVFGNKNYDEIFKELYP